MMVAFLTACPGPDNTTDGGSTDAGTDAGVNECTATEHARFLNAPVQQGVTVVQPQENIPEPCCPEP